MRKKILQRKLIKTMERIRAAKNDDERRMLWQQANKITEKIVDCNTFLESHTGRVLSRCYSVLAAIALYPLAIAGLILAFILLMFAYPVKWIRNLFQRKEQAPEENTIAQTLSQMQLIRMQMEDCPQHEANGMRFRALSDEYRILSDKLQLLTTQIGQNEWLPTDATERGA